jgi:hypothetical protein
MYPRGFRRVLTEPMTRKNSEGMSLASVLQAKANVPIGKVNLVNQCKPQFIPGFESVFLTPTIPC